MEKERFIRFVNKYNLAGSVESVKLEVENNTLQTTFISDDKSLLGIVKMDNFEFRDVELGVYDTSKLLKMLSVLDDSVEFDVKGSDDKLTSIKFKDAKTVANYMLADMAVIPKTPDLKKLPEWNVIIKFDKGFIDRFIRAKNALADLKNFTLLTDGDGIVKIVLGHSNMNTNRITLETETEIDFDLDPISFSADYLKEVLSANKEAKEATLEVSSQGLSHISFSMDDFSSEYFLVEQQS